MCMNDIYFVIIVINYWIKGIIMIGYFLVWGVGVFFVGLYDVFYIVLE